MTRLVFDPVATIRKDIETWDSPFVELDCFGTDNAGQIATMVRGFADTTWTVEFAATSFTARASAARMVCSLKMAVTSSSKFARRPKQIQI